MTELRGSTRGSIAGGWLAPACPQQNHNVNCSSLRGPCYFPDLPTFLFLVLLSCINQSISNTLHGTLFTTLTATSPILKISGDHRLLSFAPTALDVTHSIEKMASKDEDEEQILVADSDSEEMTPNNKEKGQVLSAKSDFEKWLVDQKDLSIPNISSISRRGTSLQEYYKQNRFAFEGNPDFPANDHLDISASEWRGVGIVFLLIAIPAIPGFYLTVKAYFFCAELDEREQESVQKAWAWLRWTVMTFTPSVAFNSRTKPWVRFLMMGLAFWASVLGRYRGVELAKDWC